ncbi:MAG: putative LPS assembly protein LptD [Chitinophagaceae bacterium]
MIKKRKNSLKQGSAWFLLFSLLLLTQDLAANYSHSTFFDKFLTTYRDTTKPKSAKDTIPIVPGKRDTTIQTTDTFHVEMSKDSLDDKVNYEASDSMVLDIPNQRMILYSKGKVTYKDMVLTADSILMDQKTNLVTATFRRDTAGNMIGQPVMEQAGTKTISNLIVYNTKTQKGISKGAITQQGEMYVQGESVKRASPSVFWAYRGQITTCNLDTPHFAFRTRKMKLVNQKLAVSGPIHPEFEGVPVPIYLPFGFFPLSQGRHSGLLAPQFTASDQFGLGLEGLGYYKVINDNFDVTLRTNLYSYGGWALFVTPTYRKRYRYNGTFNFSMQNSRILTTDAKEEYTTSRTFNIAWTHTVDSRARPGTSFSANVNAGSTKYNQYSTNVYRNYNNSMNSSIAYSKTWGSKYNLTASANHSQNNLTQIINLNLPTVAFTVNTLYPFQKKESVGVGKWYEKLGVGLSTNLANQVSVYEKDFNLSKILDTMQYGVQHSIPIQLALPSLGPLQISPGVSYQEKWYSRKQVREWNDVTEKVDTSVQKGFFTARDISFSLSFNTALYGKFDKFGKKSFMRAIRHVIRPSVSISYKPDLAKSSWATTRINKQGYTNRYSYYEGSIYGAFSEGKFAGMSFTLDNNLEAKVRSKKDSTGEKKIKLIDGFGITGSYNFMADSFKLSVMSIYLRSTLFDKINITAGAVLDPYQKDSLGFSINKYAWQGGKFKLGAITSGNIAMSTSFQSQPKETSKQQEQALSKNNNNPVLTPEEQLAQLSYARANPAEFADFNVDWSLSMSFSFNFARSIKSDYSGYKTTTNSNYNWNGDFNLTPRWKLGMTGAYDITNKSIQLITMYISREMHCWQMSINVTPVGLTRSFNITLSPKSGVLRDLRINRTRYFYGM